MQEQKWWKDGFDILWKRIRSEARVTIISDNRKEDLRYFIEEIESRAAENAGIQIARRIEELWTALTITAVLMTMGFAVILFKIL